MAGLAEQIKSMGNLAGEACRLRWFWCGRSVLHRKIGRSCLKTWPSGRLEVAGNRSGARSKANFPVVAWGNPPYAQAALWDLQ
jgi:hypothetical protein